MFTVRSARNILLNSSFAALLAAMTITCARSAELNIRDVPLFLNDTPPPLNMLVLSRDHRLYYEAYNDASDLDGDGEIDTRYKPLKIDYYGYFESKQCYAYSSNMFVPAGPTGADKTCSGQWSGDWLNYMTMSRVDALRKVLYGGLRYIDTDGETVLQRSYIPQDAHSWGKEYTSTQTDGYDISKYTPLSQPTDKDHRHLFANTTLSADLNVTALDNPAVAGVGPPKFRVLENRMGNRIWEWVSKESPVSGSTIDNSRFGTSSGCTGSQVITDVGVNSDLSGCSTSSAGKGTLTDYVVRVKVCSSGSYDTTNTNCKIYGSDKAKPTGLLQDYGESNSMLFGLISGSYGKPHDGGVLRKAVDSIRDEIDLPTGKFIYNKSPRGIISTIDRLRITSFDGSKYTCNGAGNPIGWIVDSADKDGKCSMWGNPTAEMMYEALRYFAGKAGPTASFDFTSNAEENTIGLTKAAWTSGTDPYRTTTGGFPACSKPFETVISDISPSYDSDGVSGSAFGSESESFNTITMNAASDGQKIWDKEIGGEGGYFIGQSGTIKDGAPTVKQVSSFGNIRGLAPEAPAKEGSYNAASVAYFGHQNDISAAKGSQKVQTFSVALASPLPNIKIRVGGKDITLVPFAKSVKWGTSGINSADGSYQPTNQIVDFYVDTITPTYGKFRVNFEDVEQGADHDMDAIATYEYTVDTVTNKVTVNVNSEYAQGGIVQHMGYVISGTTADGTYLEVRDKDTAEADDKHYFLDTRPGASPKDPNWNTGAMLQLNATRTFSPGGTAAGYLKDPLWYAAKWGGFTDTNDNGMPDTDLRAEWASKALAGDTDPDPDNYFLVTNALRLKDQLSQAFNDILDRSGSASSASVSSGSISDDTRIYQATFDSRNWAGHLLAYPVGTGKVEGTAEGALGAFVWDAATQMPAPSSRKILTIQSPQDNTAPKGLIPGSDPGGRAIPFRWDDLDAAQKAWLRLVSDRTDDNDAAAKTRLDFLRGDRSKEAPLGAFRRRTSPLGDIVNSAPVFVGAPPWRYPDNLEPSAPYSAFVAANAGRRKVVYAGANDGMMHAFDAGNGEELFAYVPYGVFRNLVKLTDPTYGHLFYVDGTPSVVDAFFATKWHTVLVSGLNKGGQSVFALDVTNPEITEANAKKAVMWEFTDQHDPDLGYTYSRPAVVKLQNGKWAAIFGNGYNNTLADGHASSTGNAVLFVVDIETGAVISKLNTGVGMAQDPLTSLKRPNGLATPAVIDKDGDGMSDTVYAGDLFGNMWKFDLSATSSGDWKVSNDGAPLFVAERDGKRQPITERPQVGRGPNGQGWVILFGTGKFMESSDRDVASLQVQSFYGIFDKATGTTGDIVPRTDLLQQTIIEDTTKSWDEVITNPDGPPTTVSHSTPVRITSANALTSGNRGWYIDLLPPKGPQGEMQVTNPVLRNGRVVFTTLIPNSDLCGYGGRSWLMDMDALSGSRLPYSPFDLNRDTEYDSDDYAGSTEVPATGRGSDAILTAPAFLQGNQSDYAVTTSSGSDTDENTIDIARSNAGPAGRGRQSWRQLR